MVWINKYEKANQGIYVPCKNKTRKDVYIWFNSNMKITSMLLGSLQFLEMIDEKYIQLIEDEKKNTTIQLKNMPDKMKIIWMRQEMNK